MRFRVTVKRNPVFADGSADVAHLSGDSLPRMGVPHVVDEIGTHGEARWADEAVEETPLGETGFLHVFPEVDDKGLPVLSGLTTDGALQIGHACCPIAVLGEAVTVKALLRWECHRAAVALVV